ncbi:hypothetical protein CERSUDRAFT_142885 [Gelatoporia subvermispora B]|uniref:Protein kinase domain-containing protein n=1 Tax=Ceriporiopsis subvermispora (strain B) TaxID=914234 RepID=M2QM49_CERS8|nr:hypothetical protein CERSUDRAFT_142885 [Gelatoporia subvermispora B]
MWDGVSEEVGAAREGELMRITFKPLLDKGAQMIRFNNELTSANSIISNILSKEPVVLQVQQELAEGKQFTQTAVGKALGAEIVNLIERNQRGLRALQEEEELLTGTMESDAEILRELTEDREIMQLQIQKWQSTVMNLNKSLESAKVNVLQGRCVAGIKKETQRAEFLKQIADERQRWERAKREMTEGSQLSEKQLRTQFDAKVEHVSLETFLEDPHVQLKKKLETYQDKISRDGRHLRIYQQSFNRIIKTAEMLVQRWSPNESLFEDDLRGSDPNEAETILGWFTRLEGTVAEISEADSISCLIRSEELKETLQLLWNKRPVATIDSQNNRNLPNLGSLRLVPSYTETFSCLKTVLADPDGPERVISLGNEDAKLFVEYLDKVLDVVDVSDPIQVQCLDILRKMCGLNYIVPKSFILPRHAISSIAARSDSHGSYADVWKGQFEGRQVALKVFRIQADSTNAENITQDLKTFCREAILWKRLRHPNITPFRGIDSTSFEPGWAIVCDWMPRGTIADYLRSNTAANRLRLILDIAEGLEYLHRSKIIHGDLKSPNILVSEQHSACLADFGLAAMHFNNQLKTITVAAGSLRWMSPELLDPEAYELLKSESTPQSDIYALSFVIWEIFTGRVPYYQYTNDGNAVARIIRGDRPRRPLRAIGLGLSDQFWAFMETCWHPEPQVRPHVRAAVEYTREMLREYGERGAIEVPHTWPQEMGPVCDAVTP